MCNNNGRARKAMDDDSAAQKNTPFARQIAKARIQTHGRNI